MAMSWNLSRFRAGSIHEFVCLFVCFFCFVFVFVNSEFHNSWGLTKYVKNECSGIFSAVQVLV